MIPPEPWTLDFGLPPLVSALRRSVFLVRVLCVANQKGGVGKTTTSINLAACLAKAGERTLLIDLDPQCNATGGLGHKPAARHALVERGPMHEAVLPTGIADLELLPGSRSFQDVDALAR